MTDITSRQLPLEIAAASGKRRGLALVRCWLSPTALTATILVFSLANATAAEQKAQGTKTSDLPTAEPASVGVDANPLIRLSQWLREEQLDVRSLLVVKDGELIFERYTDNLTRDHNYELYSVTKTIVSLLAGILIDEGRISLDDDIASIISSYRPDLAEAVADKTDIELRHVLSMSSGLAYDFDPEDDPIYYGSPDRLKLVADTAVAVPARTEFEYTDVNPVFASAMLSAAAGMPIQDYAEEKLFNPLNMKNYAWTRADDKGLVSAGWGFGCDRSIWPSSES